MSRIHFSTTTNQQSGEYVAIAQLAEAAGGTLVHDIPAAGVLFYMVNLNIRVGAEDLKALMTRRGPTAFIVGVLRGWNEVEDWRPYFEFLAKFGAAFFVHHPEQVDYLAKYGIKACFVPCNEAAWRSEAPPEPKSVIYTGFYWNEKDLPMFMRVARLLPDFRFTLHIGMNKDINREALAPNVTPDSRFLGIAEYRELLARHEMVWIPRHPSPWIYTGRSGITAVASRRTAILTAVGPNATVPDDACVKYPHDWSAEQIAGLISSRPKVDSAAVERFLGTVSPAEVWRRMAAELRLRG